MKHKQDLPVAFVSNALYVMSRNGMLEGSGSLVNDHLLPVLIEKQQWLHAEGVAHTVYALTAAKNWNQEIWAILTEQIKNKDFGYEVVKSARFDPTVYYKMNGKEHFFESDFNKFGHDLFF